MIAGCGGDGLPSDDYLTPQRDWFSLSSFQPAAAQDELENSADHRLLLFRFAAYGSLAESTEDVPSSPGDSPGLFRCLPVARPQILRIKEAAFQPLSCISLFLTRFSTERPLIHPLLLVGPSMPRRAPESRVLRDLQLRRLPESFSHT